MALKAVIDKLEDVAEPLRTEYKKADDGKFCLDVNGVDDMPAVVGLKRKNQELLDEKKKVDQKLAGFGEETPEKIAELRKQLEKGGTKDVKELEQKLAQTQQQAQIEIKAAQEKATTATKAAEEYFLTSEMTKTLTDAKGSPALLLHVMRERIEVKTVDGKFQTVVIDPKTKAARIKDSAGHPMTLADVAAELKADQTYGRAFDASGKGGSGAENGGGGGGSKVIANDPLEIGRNLEAIAKGEVTVAGVQ